MGASAMHCPNCNERLPLSARACFGCGALVRRDGPPGAAASRTLPEHGRLTAAAPLRDRPYASARQIMTLPAGQIVAVTGMQWGFAQVETPDGRRGFVDSAAVGDDTVPAASAPAPPARPLPQRSPVSAAPHQSIRDQADAPSPHTAAGLPRSEEDRAHQPSAPVCHRIALPGAPVTSLRPARPQVSAAPPPASAGPAAPAAITVVSDLAQAAADAVAAAEPVDDAVRQREPHDIGRRRKAAPATIGAAQVEGRELPFNIPLLEGEQTRYRAVFLYNPQDDQALVVTNRRLILTGGTIGKLPRVLYLDEVEAVRLQDSGTGSTNGEGNLFITMTGMRGSLHVGGVYMAHHVRNEILAACTDLHRTSRSGARRKTG